MPEDFIDNPDAAVWADEFMKRFTLRVISDGDVGWGTMVGWFANAIECGKRNSENPRA